MRFLGQPLGRLPQRQGGGERGGDGHRGDQPDRTNERRDDLLGHDLVVRGVADAEIRGAEEEEDRQGGADAGEYHCVDGGADVVAAHFQRAPEELSEPKRRVRVTQRDDRRGLPDIGVKGRKNRTPVRFLATAFTRSSGLSRVIYSRRNTPGCGYLDAAKYSGSILRPRGESGGTMSSISFRDRHRIAEDLEPFGRLQLLDGLWHGYVRDFDPARGDLAEALLVADELDKTLTHCAQSARDLKEVLADHPSEVNTAAETISSAQDLTPDAENLWRKALQGHGDGAALARHVFDHLEERLPQKQEELQEQRRDLQEGKSGQADMTMGESCAMTVMAKKLTTKKAATTQGNSLL